MVFIMINPGTEGRPGATEANAIVSADALCTALSLPAGSMARDAKHDDRVRGFFAFKLALPGHVVEIDIPGDDPADTIAGKPFVSRRLYVDGSSWLWG